MEGITLLDIFRSFTGGKSEIESKDYAKFYEETGIIDKKFTINDADINFAKVKSGKVNVITFEQFEKTLELAAAKKGTTKDALIQKIINNGGSMEFEYNIGADNSMIDFAKMAILLAFHEYPINDDENEYKRAELVMKKFNEKYGNYWSVTFIIRGNLCCHYDSYFIKIKYNCYKISIWKNNSH